MSRLSGIRAFVIACALTASAFGQLCGLDWAPSNFSAMLDGSVMCSAVFDPGTGPQLYVGGDFTTAGGAASPGIAMWNGTTWNSVGGGVTGNVRALCVHDDGSGPKLYVGGWFTGPGVNVARWDGFAWSPAGVGFNSGCEGLASYDDGGGLKLYAGGWFNTSGDGSTLLSRFARWDGLTWSSVNQGLSSGLNCMNVFNGALYIFGSFGTAGGITAPGMVRYNGTWANIGTVAGGSVNRVEVHDDGTGPAMYVCGNFVTIAGTAANRVAKFDGTSWTALGSGLGGLAYGLASFNDGSGSALYVSGAFTTAGGAPANRIARWSGGTWSTLSNGISVPSAARTLMPYPTPYGMALFVGGNFPSAGSIPVATPNVAIWGPTPPFAATQPASQAVNAGANVSFTVVAGGAGVSYQWQHNFGPITGATNPTLNLTNVSPLDWGVYDCVMTNGCGTTTTAPATLTLNPGFTLTMNQPFGPLSLFLQHSSPGQPGAYYLTTFSFDPMNSSNTGQGPWAGMFVSFTEIVNQFLYGFPPFIGTLDGGGNAFFLLASGQLPAALFGVPVTAVSMTFNPSPISLINNSNLILMTIQ